MLLAHVNGLPHHAEEYRVLATLLFFAPIVARLIIYKLQTKEKNMPCDTIRTVTVDIGKVDPGLIDAAIKSLGLSGSVSYSNNRLNISGNLSESEITNKVKQAYSAEVVKSQAKKLGWQLKPHPTTPFKYQIIKR